MRSILRGMYQGEIIPWTRGISNSKKRCDIFKKIENEEKYFKAKLSPDDCQRLTALSDLYTQLTVVDEEDLYAYAFSLGMLMAMETLKETEGIFHE